MSLSFLFLLFALPSCQCFFFHFSSKRVTIYMYSASRESAGKWLPRRYKLCICFGALISFCTYLWHWCCFIHWSTSSSVRASVCAVYHNSSGHEQQVHCSHWLATPMSAAETLCTLLGIMHCAFRICFPVLPLIHFQGRGRVHLALKPSFCVDNYRYYYYYCPMLLHHLSQKGYY